MFTQDLQGFGLTRFHQEIEGQRLKVVQQADRKLEGVAAPRCGLISALS